MNARRVHVVITDVKGTWVWSRAIRVLGDDAQPSGIGALTDALNAVCDEQHTEEDDDRCEHGMFFTGAGACPMCREGLT